MEHSADEMMTVAAARELRDGEVCFVGIGLPSTAANLARGRHAPDVVLIYESGTIGSKPTRLPLSIGDGDLAETADSVVSVPEIFNYWLQGGRIDVGFLGAAQIDRHGNLNSTVIGRYDEPKVRLPGAGGAPEIAALTKRVITIIRQSPRTFVGELDFKTSLGAADQVVITDLGVLRKGSDPSRPAKGSDPSRPAKGSDPTRPAKGSDPTRPAKGSDPSRPADGSRPRGRSGSDPYSGAATGGSDPLATALRGRATGGSDPYRELTLTALHPGVTLEQAREATGWELAVADELETTEPPTEDELELLRELKSA